MQKSLLGKTSKHCLDRRGTYRAAFGTVITWWTFGARWAGSTRGTCFTLFTSFTFRTL